MKKVLTIALALFVLLLSAAYYWALGTIALIVAKEVLKWPYTVPVLIIIFVILLLMKIGGDIGHE